MRHQECIHCLLVSCVGFHHGWWKMYLEVEKHPIIVCETGDHFLQGQCEKDEDVNRNFWSLEVDGEFMVHVII